MLNRWWSAFLLERSRHLVSYGLVPAIRWSERKLSSAWRMFEDSSARMKGHIKSIISRILGQGTKLSPCGSGAEKEQHRGDATARNIPAQSCIKTTQRFVQRQPAGNPVAQLRWQLWRWCTLVVQWCLGLMRLIWLLHYRLRMQRGVLLNSPHASDREWHLAFHFRSGMAPKTYKVAPANWLHHPVSNVTRTGRCKGWPPINYWAQARFG